MSLDIKNSLVIKVAIGLAVAGLIVWAASAQKPGRRCPLSPNGQHDFMVGGDGVSECWWCNAPKPK